MEMTDRQKQIYNFIKKFIDKNKFSPTFREIGDEFNINIKAVHDHINAIKRKGFIAREFGKTRTIRILK